MVRIQKSRNNQFDYFTIVDYATMKFPAGMLPICTSRGDGQDYDLLHDPQDSCSQGAAVPQRETLVPWGVTLGQQSSRPQASLS